MDKAILVMDMPESCSKCMFLYEFNGIKKCNLMNVMYGGASRLSQSNFTECRHEKCPLKPLPEKMEYDYCEHNFFTHERIGFNRCLREILGE